MQTSLSSYDAEISFSPKRWSYVNSTRLMVSSFCNMQLEDEAMADKITVTAQELLENAAKYTADPDENVSVRFAVLDGNRVMLEVSNPATPEGIQNLKAQHAQISEGDPLMAYLQRMQRIATNPDTPDSQLGLARIRYETGSELQLRVEGRVVTMGVEFPLRKESA